ncbi:sulfotransferase family 2 domain-containing protein [Sulfitobacter sabulilitoris]|uniref:Sulfotransferase family protein n=1 Tax=Sulfitobacter sabulilitoris TaxID=2562655 RepID=A0A5S3QDZ8_9RHOB|nr:sulfotransferase family 2 domain-containing protein [Sulfitobacter sabulilitoris]TMM55382.1 sulfotransferase family protein [Sulfitobacter sabulilitoris]
MIISPGRRYIFVHIPKTGGTSLARALEGRAMKDDILVGDTPKARRRRGRVRGVTAAGRLWKHSTLADIDGLVSPEDMAGMFCFTLVRNPWDRVVSYYHWLRDQRFDHPAVTLARALPFDGFLRDPQTQASLRAAPAASYMRDAGGVDRAAAYVRIEAFARDARALFDHLGFDLTPGRENASDRVADYRGYYDPSLRQIVAETCAEDIARFGYRFD